MKKITHIRVAPDNEGDPDDPPKAVYVDPPAADVLEAEPLKSGRHRIERMPEGEDDKPPATLWSWSEGPAQPDPGSRG
jgi:hypothetical protein